MTETPLSTAAMLRITIQSFRDAKTLDDLVKAAAGHAKFIEAIKEFDEGWYKSLQSSFTYYKKRILTKQGEL